MLSRPTTSSATPGAGDARGRRGRTGLHPGRVEGRVPRDSGRVAGGTDRRGHRRGGRRRAADGRQVAERVGDHDRLAGLGRQRGQGQGPQLDTHRGRRLRTAERVAGHRPVQQVQERVAGLVTGAVVGQVDVGVLGRGAQAGEHLDADPAHGVEVGALVGIGAAPLLGGHVARGADDHRRPGHPGLVERDRDPEVGEPQVRHAAAGRLEQQVGGLDVAVDDARGVHRLQGLERLVDQQGSPAQRQDAVRLEQVGDRAATDQRHREQHPVVHAGPRLRRHHVGVVDAHRLLAHEAQQRSGIGLAQDLGGLHLVVGSVEDAPDRAHASHGDRARAARERPAKTSPTGRPYPAEGSRAAVSGCGAPRRGRCR